MRFTRKNWVKFFDGSAKKTTIRLKMNRKGHHNAWAGRYMHPEKLGEFDITYVNTVPFGVLCENDAVNDGFKTLNELKTELVRLNGDIELETDVFIHWVENAKNTI